MSAIAGVIGLNGAELPQDAVHNLLESLSRYAGDAQQQWHGEQAALGCRLQWLTSEAVHAANPYYDPRSGLTVVADAILDNRDELFDKLQVHLKQRVQMSDQELILHAYLKWGEQAPVHLIGDFAFVIWDERNRKLLGARDLCGNRTLYFHTGPRMFAFCSAIAPLRELPGIAQGLDENWLSEFLAIPVMFESTDVQATAYAEIRQLPPAHLIVAEGSHVKLSCYGSLLPDRKLRLSSNGEYEEAFREVMNQAVHCRLRTYREVGATLSGGLDSGIVASYAARELRRQGKLLHTFSHVPSPDFVDWTGRNRAADETPYINATLSHVGNMRSNYIDVPGASPLTGVEDWLDILEMPYKYFENSYWIKGIYELAREQGIGILLTGAKGNNTISWGPTLDYFASLIKRLQWVKFYRELQLYGRKRGIRRSRLVPLIGKRMFPWLSLLSGSGDEMPLLINPEFARRTDVQNRLRKAGVSLNNGSGSSAAEARRKHFENLAVHNMTGNKSSKLSLHYGIWERDPTFDVRVVRFCLSVPMDQYMQQGLDRALVRRAAVNDLPDTVRLNQRVRGIQGADWLHRMLPQWPALLEELEQLCRDERAVPYMNVEQIRRTISQASGPSVRDAFEPEPRFLMRSLIMYRFLKRYYAS
ncbi:asparagine synthase-related protein [Paenibacillus sp. GCM10012307]|uniref:asparagine synthase (glutamine-hydrolyzing) n=1 Tax=Paenibacillus roseus TaxID=2798579 RepID=A0A934MNW3_9BACL|nr:asparagine synthase-related protein [Paenibacillus roseus]MBJ6360248.1 asparagine synthetase B [Paenibacillus roseus]